MKQRRTHTLLGTAQLPGVSVSGRLGMAMIRHSENHEFFM